MKVRVTSSFVTRWYEEWERTGDSTLHTGHNSRVTYGEKHQRVERFLEAMAPDLARVLKHQLLEALLAETAARLVPEVHSAGSTEIPVDSPPVA